MISKSTRVPQIIEHRRALRLEEFLFELYWLNALRLKRCFLLRIPLLREAVLLALFLDWPGLHANNLKGRRYKGLRIPKSIRILKATDFSGGTYLNKFLSRN